jgi:peptidyl-prolyl cis-trans isomerase C
MTCSVRDAAFNGRPDKISVNGVVIGRDAVAREAQNHPARKPVAAWSAAACALVVRELLLQEARRVVTGATPMTDADGRRESEDEARIRTLIEQEVTTPEPDEDTCRRYYEQNRRRFRSADLYEAAHILFAASRSDKAAYARAREQATAALAVLKAAPERFGELAAAHSACPSAKQGGNLGQIGIGETTPEFEDALTAMEPGTIRSEPLETRYGVHILRLDRKHEGRELPFALVADRIADYLQESVRRRSTAQYIARLVSRATITGLALDGAEAHRVY